MPQLIRCITDVAASSPIIWSRDFRPPFIVFNAFRPHQCTKCGCGGGGGGGGGGGRRSFSWLPTTLFKGLYRVTARTVRKVKEKKTTQQDRYEEKVYFMGLK